MTLLPQIQRGLLDAIGRDQRRSHAARAARRLWRSHPRRRLAALGATALAAAAALLVVTLAGAGAPSAFAGWSAAPTAARNGQLRAAETACARRGRAVTSRAPTVIDTRGPYALLLYTGAVVNAVCVTGLPGGASIAETGGIATTTVRAVAPDTILPGQAGVERADGHWFSDLTGRVGSHVTRLVLILENASTVTATIADGWFAAWWPSGQNVASARITAAGVTTAQPWSVLQDRGGPPLSPPQGRLRLTFKNDLAYVDAQPIRVAMVPLLRAGWVELLMTQSIPGPGPALASGLSNYPTRGAPAFGFPAEGISFRIVGDVPEPVWGAPVGAAGEIDMLLVGPGVASVRVAHLGTFKAVHVLGLLPGQRAIVFYRPPGARGAVLGPGETPQIVLQHAKAEHRPVLAETLYNSAGKAISIRWASFRVPTTFWAAPALPSAAARCAVRSVLPGAIARWGQVVSRIVADPGVIGPAFLSCLYTTYSWHGTTFDVGVLLNAQSPGSPPARLWGALPVARHPGLVQTPSVEYRERVAARSVSGAGETHFVTVQLAPASTARRAGNAWLVVRGGRSLAQRVQFLAGLHVSRLAVKPGN